MEFSRDALVRHFGTCGVKQSFSALVLIVLILLVTMELVVLWERQRSNEGQITDVSPANFLLQPVNGPPFPEDNSRDDLPSYQYRNFSGKPHSKWIIVDFTSAGCVDKLFRTSRDWKWLVIAGSRTLKDCSAPRCIILTPELNLTKDLTPEGQKLWWRNTAYLMAISFGAVHILEADCRLKSTDAPLAFNLNTTAFTGLMYNSTQFFNPYQHFSLWNAVPRRGRWLTRAENNSRAYYIRDLPRVFILHGLTDRDLVERDSGQINANGLRFNPSAPPVFVGQTTYAQVYPCCTLYHKNAFWGLLLPRIYRPEVNVVLRQYIVQRLFREIDAFTGFFQVKTAFRSRDVRLPFSETAGDFLGQEEEDRLVSYLDQWTCPPQLAFFSCMLALAGDLVKFGILASGDWNLIHSWIEALKSAGLEEPVRVASPWRGVRKVGEVIVVLGKVEPALEEDGSQQTLEENTLRRALQICAARKQINTLLSVTRWRQPVFNDIVLIVVFNENKHFYSNFPYLETIHRAFFRHIVYCVPDVTELLADDRHHILSHVTLVEALSDSWYLMHECLMDVALINYQGVRGYLQIGDDTLINTWGLQNLSRDSMWTPLLDNEAEADAHNSWYWWEKSRGRLAAVQALANLETLSGLTEEELLQLDSHAQTSNNKTFTKIFRLQPNTSSVLPLLPGSEAWSPPSTAEARQFLATYIRERKMAGKLSNSPMDFFYVPQTKIKDYITFSRFFMKYRVIDELTLPIMQFGMSRVYEIVNVSCVSLWWRRDRIKAFDFYNDNITFIHPLKLASNMASHKGRVFFCRKYLPYLFPELSDLSRSRESTRLTALVFVGVFLLSCFMSGLARTLGGKIQSYICGISH